MKRGARPLPGGSAKYTKGRQTRKKGVVGMEIQACLYNRDPSTFPQRRSKPVPTREIQTSSQNPLRNGDPRRFTQRRSKPVPIMRNRPRWVTSVPTHPYMKRGARPLPGGATKKKCVVMICQFRVHLKGPHKACGSPSSSRGPLSAG